MQKIALLKERVYGIMFDMSIVARFWKGGPLGWSC
jgi:hypothetical protein